MTNSQALRKKDNSKYKKPLITKIGKKYFWGSLNLTNPIKEIIDEAHTQAIKEVLEIIDKLKTYCYDNESGWYEHTDSDMIDKDELKARLSGDAK